MFMRQADEATRSRRPGTSDKPAQLLGHRVRLVADQEASVAELIDIANLRCKADTLTVGVVKMKRMGGLQGK